MAPFPGTRARLGQREPGPAANRPRRGIVVTQESTLAQGTTHIARLAGRFFRHLFRRQHAKSCELSAGVHYQRKANFTTHKLLDATGTTVVPTSIGPFFLRLSRRRQTGMTTTNSGWARREHEEEVARVRELIQSTNTRQGEKAA